MAEATICLRGEPFNVASSYLKQILGFIGITDVTIVLAGGTAAVSMQKVTLPDLVAQFAPAVSAAAAS